MASNNYATHAAPQQQAPVELEQPGPVHGYYAAQPQQQTQPAPFQQWPGSYGEQYQSYSQYTGQAQAQNASDARNAEAGGQQQQQQQYWNTQQGFGTALPEDTRKWMITKMVLHTMSIVFGLIIIGLTVSLSNSGILGLASLVTIPVPAATIIWSAAEIITRAVHKFKTGIHPGAHVALHLLIWLASSILGGIYVTSAILISDLVLCDGDFNSETGDYDFSDECSNSAQGQTAALAAFTVLIFIINFFLFIVACIDTHKRNRAMRKQPVMVIQNPGAYFSGWQPMPGQQGMPMNEYPVQDGQQQQNGQYMAVPMATARRDSFGHNGSPSPVSTPYQTPMEAPVMEKGPGQQVGEFYAPNQR